VVKRLPSKCETLRSNPSVAKKKKKKKIVSLYFLSIFRIFKDTLCPFPAYVPLVYRLCFYAYQTPPYIVIIVAVTMVTALVRNNSCAMQLTQCVQFSSFWNAPRIPSHYHKTLECFHHPQKKAHTQ
jgi:hypothetical protein